MKLTYPAIFTWTEGAGYFAELPDFPDIMGIGKTWEEAREDALSHLQSALSRSAVYPAPSDPASIEIPEDGFLRMISIDTDDCPLKSTENSSCFGSLFHGISCLVQTALFLLALLGLALIWM